MKQLGLAIAAAGAALLAPAALWAQKLDLVVINGVRAS